MHLYSARVFVHLDLINLIIIWWRVHHESPHCLVFIYPVFLATLAVCP